MTKNYPNIVPENNLRLPDTLTIKHGPARLLSTFVLEGDKAARRVGVRLRLRHDFGELLTRPEWFVEFYLLFISRQFISWLISKMFETQTCLRFL